MNEHLFQAVWPITQTNRHTNTHTDRIHSAYRTRLKSITKTLNYTVTTHKIDRNTTFITNQTL